MGPENIVIVGGGLVGQTLAERLARDGHDVALIEGGHTFYARFGDVFGYLCVLLCLGAWLVWPRIRRVAALPCW